MSVIKLSEVNLHNKMVLIREDFNVPIKDKEIQSDLRLKAAIPGLETILEQNPKRLLILSHLGRPEEGIYDDALSLSPVAKRLRELLNQPVGLCRNWVNDKTAIEQTSEKICLLENVRFNTGEKDNNAELSQYMASLCDVFVMDAFAAVHRAQASTCGVAKFAPVACAGPLLSRELEALANALQSPQTPLLAIVGGAKVSSKLGVLRQLLSKVQSLIVGGGMANTFLAALGAPMGTSLYEKALLPDAKQLLAQAEQTGVRMLLPSDVVVATEISETAQTHTKSIYDVSGNDMICDIGPKTIHDYEQAIKEAGTIVWNGPVGIFEHTPFAKGTIALAHSIANSAAFSMAGGGDTLAALEKANCQDRMSYISTGGGAFLEYLEGKLLPAIAMLVERGKQ